VFSPLFAFTHPSIYDGRRQASDGSTVPESQITHFPSHLYSYAIPVSIPYYNNDLLFLFEIALRLPAFRGLPCFIVLEFGKELLVSKGMGHSMREKSNRIHHEDLKK